MLRIIAFAGLVLLGAASPAAAYSRPASFKDWNVVCDNTLTCSAIGGTLYTASPFYVQIVRDAGPGAQPALSIGFWRTSDAGRAPSRLWIETADGRVLFETRLVLKEIRYWRARRLSLPLNPALLAALRDGARVRLKIEEPQADDLEVSLAGASAALRWMDARQGRAGTVTALVARGAAPAARVPPAPSAPQVRRAPAASQQGLPKRPPEWLRAELVCEGDARPGPFVYRLGRGRLLWLAPCENIAGYNTGVRMFMSDESGRRLPDPPADRGFDDGDDEADLHGGQTNLDFDPATRILTATVYFRQMRDCGWKVQWVWDGHAFRRVRLSMTYDEQAVFDWPVWFRARIVDR